MGGFDEPIDDGPVYDPQQWFELDTSFGPLTATGFQSVSMHVATSAVPESSTALLLALGMCAVVGTRTFSARRA